MGECVMLNTVNVDVEQGLVILNSGQDGIWGSFPNLLGMFMEYKVMSKEDADLAPKVGFFSRKPVELAAYLRVKKRLNKEGIAEDIRLYSHPSLSRLDASNKGNMLIDLNNTPEEMQMLFALIKIHNVPNEELKQTLKSLALLREIKDKVNSMVQRFEIDNISHLLTDLEGAFEYKEDLTVFQNNLTLLIQIFANCLNTCIAKIDERIENYIAGKPLLSLI